MSIAKNLLKRCESKCELCGSTDELFEHEVTPSTSVTNDTIIAVCNNCLSQIEDKEKIEINHWRCLNDSMWSEVTAVQVMAWRMLYQIKNEGWPQDLLDMLYLDDETVEWAKAGIVTENEGVIKHTDVNGVELQAGDSVVLIKDLNVKGSSLVAKRGTPVRNIILDHDNPEFIEGKVNGQHIVIITKYVKKTS